MIEVFTTPECTRCKEVKDYLLKSGIEHKSLDMRTPESITELRINGCFALSAPVVKTSAGEYLTVDDLYKKGPLDTSLLK